MRGLLLIAVLVALIIYEAPWWAFVIWAAVLFAPWLIVLFLSALALVWVARVHKQLDRD